MRLGIEFWEFLVSGARDTWRVVVAPRGKLSWDVCACDGALDCDMRIFGWDLSS